MPLNINKYKIVLTCFVGRRYSSLASAQVASGFCSREITSFFSRLVRVAHEPLIHVRGMYYLYIHSRQQITNFLYTCVVLPVHTQMSVDHELLIHVRGMYYLYIYTQPSVDYQLYHRFRLQKIGFTCCGFSCYVTSMKVKFRVPSLV